MASTRCNIFKRRKTQPNLLQRLQSRETLRGKPNTGSLESRKFYQNVFPDHTVYNVEVPNCFIKKFTSDGEYLLAFTKNLQGIQLYHFRGPQEGAASVHENKFDTYFTFMYEKFLTCNNEVLCRDFCLQSSCGNFLILASSGPSANPPSSSLSSSIGTPEPSLSDSGSFSPPTFGIQPPPDAENPFQNLMNGLSNLEDVTFYLVGLHDGQVYDKRSFKRDFIHLAHHGGVYLYDNLFVVLSLHTQTIHLFQIKGTQFVDVRTIGHQCFEDDDLELARQRELEQQYESEVSQSKQNIPSFCPDEAAEASLQSLLAASVSCQQYLNQPDGKGKNGVPLAMSTGTSHEQQGEILVGSSGPIVGIKHRLLAFLFRKASESPNPQALGLFYQQFNQYSSLVMWKMQLLDQSHLLLKFGNVDGVLLRSQGDLSSQTAFFVVYNMYTTEVVGVYENTNKEFAETFEQFCEHFRASSCPAGSIKYRTTCSNNSFVREHLMKQKMAVMTAKNGGETQAVKRILSALPFSPQSWSESPYFDKSLYNYDEKVISSTERPKPCAEYPIKFYSRDDGQVHFRITPGLPDKNDRTKKFASYIFHPLYPFVISVQHALFQPSVVNFHFRKQDS